MRPGYLVPSQILYFYLAPSKSPQNLGYCWPGVVLQGGIGHIGHFFAQSLFHNPIHQITIDFDFVFFLLHISSDYILVCWPHWIALRVVGLQFLCPKFFRALGIPFPRFNVTNLNNDIKSIQNLDVFKNMIKTVLFREAFIS